MGIDINNLSESQKEQIEIDSFLGRVEFYAHKYPNLLNDIVQRATRGLQKLNDDYREKAMDMELVAVAAMSQATSTKYTKANHMWSNGLILSKLKKNEPIANCNWSVDIERCENWLKLEGLIKDGKDK